MLISRHSIGDLQSGNKLQQLIIEELFFLKSRLFLYPLSITAYLGIRNRNFIRDVLLHYLINNINDLKIKQLITIQNRNIINIIFWSNNFNKVDIRL